MRQALIKFFSSSMDNNDLKKRLTKLQWEVTQNQGTEPPFKNEYYKTDTKGIYNCICCGETLFTSENKFYSVLACGWPAFSKAEDQKTKYFTDNTHGMTRTEVKCSNCNAHLGHVFDDGPGPTGVRYCINSASINLNEKK